MSQTGSDPTSGVLDAGRVTVDLGALTDNYRLLVGRLDGAACGAAVKADGYGLGIGPVAGTLFDAGCRQFFVATVGEAGELSSSLTTAGSVDGVEIHVLNGVMAGTEDVLDAGSIVPVLNSLDQIERWSARARRAQRVLPATLHIDTGMHRLGLGPDEFDRLCDNPSVLDGLRIGMVMSHLACADEPGHPRNQVQLDRFATVRRRLQPLLTTNPTWSLANSGGIFLGADYHHDLARPGIALYGGHPSSGANPVVPNPMATVATLDVPIIQVRTVQPGETVGYGASHEVGAEPARIATVAAGYADGFLRSGSNHGVAAIAGQQVPIVGRVSMDLVTVDVSAVPSHRLHPGAPVELIGPHCPVDEVAERAGTISYELLVSLGRRYRRRHLPSSPT